MEVAQQNRAAEQTEEEEAARKTKIADRPRQDRVSQEYADPSSLDTLDEISIAEHYCGKVNLMCTSCSSQS